MSTLHPPVNWPAVEQAVDDFLDDYTADQRAALRAGILASLHAPGWGWPYTFFGGDGTRTTIWPDGRHTKQGVR